MERNIEKAKLLIEALPYIRSFQGQTIVIKYGGSLMFDEHLRAVFAEDIALLKLVGLHPIIVHGGGKEISRWMTKIGKEPKFIDGLRYTDAETLEVTEMVLSGKVNREVVSVINAQNGMAVGISGKDANLFTAKKIKSPAGEDLGFVGEIEETRPKIVEELTHSGYIPVIACIAESLEGETLNINADHAAAAIGAAVGALKVIYLTDVDGIMIDGKLQKDLSLNEATSLLESPEVSGGMIPKLRCSIEAIKNHVGSVQIINGTVEHAVLLELFTDLGIGTKISYLKRTS